MPWTTLEETLAARALLLQRDPHIEPVDTLILAIDEFMRHLVEVPLPVLHEVLGELGITAPPRSSHCELLLRVRDGLEITLLPSLKNYRAFARERQKAKRKGKKKRGPNKSQDR